MSVILTDGELTSNNIFGGMISNDNNKNQDLPIKKCHYLEGKYFIVIDHTIAERLNFYRCDITRLYFQQELNEDCIILRPYKFR